ncbi:hypothetical protein [Aliamphritea ceti]|uniref:hypothetical protein n=1 Tax=Aliamphritea ceti TaxID=1524258 RepID=UPI0021C31F2B|nr:hypothetical protein [Aliamphritea ceti]
MVNAGSLVALSAAALLVAIALPRKPLAPPVTVAEPMNPVAEPLPETSLLGLWEGVKKQVVPVKSDKKDYSIVYAEKRGLRNNNPGNIRHGSPWQGMADVQKDQSFITFRSPEYGIRAMARVLGNYQKIHGLNTVRGVIGRWAPPVENDTDSYVNAVARSLNVSPDQTINVQAHMLPLIKSIVHHENGLQPYSDALIKDGIALA